MEHTFKTIDQLDITDAFCAAYNRLLSELLERECNVTTEELNELKERKDSELVLFIFDGEGSLAGTAQASYLSVPETYGVYVNSVVVDESYRGQGLGKLLMDELQMQVKARWSRAKKITLTSSPKKGTQGFYLKLGYRMRTKEAGDETIVYVKDI